MNIEEIKKVLCVGAGSMGQQISLQCALHGYTVALHARKEESLKKAMAVIQRYAKKMVDDGKISQEKADNALHKIKVTNQRELAAEEADLMIESIPEVPAQKAETFRVFGSLCPPRTIFATNTSMLLPSMFAETSGRPDKFIAMHFHTYVWSSNVVDIMLHAKTSDETLNIARAFALRIGQIPIVLKKETSGYLFNAMMSSLNTTALCLASNEIASVKDIDLAWRAIMKMSIGPFGMMDHIGLDTIWEIINYWADEKNDEKMRSGADYVRKYVDENKLGVKSGEGFYKYTN